MLRTFTILGCFLLTALAVTLSGCGNGDSDQPAPFIVGAAPSQGLTPTHPTIQEAVDAAIAHAVTNPEAAAQRVLILPGAYTGNISIDASSDFKLVIKGLGSDPADVVIEGLVEGADPIIEVSRAGEIVIENLTVNGMSGLEPTEPRGAVVGIRFEDASGRIENVAVINIRNGDGSAQGLAIQVQGIDAGAFDPGMPPATKRIEITGNTIMNFTRVGILVDGYGVDVSIRDNNLVGLAMSEFWAPNGIQVSHGATGEIINNSVDDAISPTAPEGAGSGIIFYCTQEGHAENNAITGTDLGISLVDVQETIVRNNTILFTDTGVPVQVLGRFFGDSKCGAILEPSRNNVVNNNNISQAFSAGIQLESFDLAVGIPIENRFEGNVILGQGPDALGIVVLQANNNVFVNNLIDAPALTGGVSTINTAVVDQTVGNGTASTANTYINNQCIDSEPAGLCGNPTLTTVAGRAPRRAGTRSAQRHPAPYMAKR
ncbi:MAG: right-handed parallel beta-helix repeat-containing protein [Candidatus Tectomicrobia bacterium]|nr:right-handed parallel beta-helix repeat-containing protein [Candidatus Tectomicrobia bacterium]